MNTDSSPLGSITRVDTRGGGPGIEAFPLEFSGSGGEFFRVWIVNLLLTIVTLGFYTPFARRRTAQYFYSHTLVGNSPLEFTAQQRKMVFGFLLLVVIYGAFNLATETGQDAAVALFLLAGAALAPYFWASAMRFRLSATRWRGVRLQFSASWAEVYKASWPVFAMALVWIAVVAAFAAWTGDAPAGGAAAARLLPKVPALAWLLPVGAAGRQCALHHPAGVQLQEPARDQGVYRRAGRALEAGVRRFRAHLGRDPGHVPGRSAAVRGARGSCRGRQPGGRDQRQALASRHHHCLSGGRHCLHLRAVPDLGAGKGLPRSADVHSWCGTTWASAPWRASSASCAPSATSCCA